MQEIDAARRTAILRGEVPPPLPEEAADTSPKRERSGRYDGRGRDRKRRRLRGEDDTARDIRYAREDAEAGEQARTTLTTHSTSDAPLLDHTGHINLFPAPDEREIRKAERNAEADAEIAKKRKEYEDNYTVRFSDAAGYKRGLQNPWYAAQTKGDTSSITTTEPSKDVWGNEDPRRKEREQMRTSANDPIAFMQRAQAQLKQAEKDREKWQKEKVQELEELKRTQERQRRTEWKHLHRRRSRSVDSLEGFSLNTPMREHGEKRGDKDRRRSRHDRHRSRSRHRSKSREHRHQSSRTEHRRRSRSPGR